MVRVLGAADHLPGVARDRQGLELTHELGNQIGLGAHQSGSVAPEQDQGHGQAGLAEAHVPGGDPAPCHGQLEQVVELILAGEEAIESERNRSGAQCGSMIGERLQPPGVHRLPAIPAHGRVRDGVAAVDLLFGEGEILAAGLVVIEPVVAASKRDRLPGLDDGRAPDLGIGEMGFAGGAGRVRRARRGIAGHQDGMAKRGALDAQPPRTAPQIVPHAGVAIDLGIGPADGVEQGREGGHGVVLDQVRLEIERALSAVAHAGGDAVFIARPGQQTRLQDGIADARLGEAAAEL